MGYLDPLRVAVFVLKALGAGAILAAVIGFFLWLARVTNGYSQ